MLGARSLTRLGRRLARVRLFASASASASAASATCVRATCAGDSGGGGGCSGGGGVEFPQRLPRRRADLNVLDRLRWSSADVAVESAVTLPSPWYTEEAAWELERRHVFGANWIVVGRSAQVARPGDYFTGTLLDEPFIVVRDEHNVLHAWYNVCRHHAMAVASGSGCASQFVCPYHGWTYTLAGQLRKATRLKGIKNFRPATNGLVPIPLLEVGPFIFLYVGGDSDGGDVDDASRASGDAAVAAPALPPSLPSLPSRDHVDKVAALLERTDYSRLTYVRTLSYTLRCNWKVFVDNYLDGGYHVPYAHPGLTSDLNMSSYRIDVGDRYSVQSCDASSAASSSSSSSSSSASSATPARVHGTALYAFLYPNVTINRYGPWMDTNLVVPLDHNRCRVDIDYYLDPSAVSEADRDAFIERSLKDSDAVQQEDIGLCEGVQRGLHSRAYHSGRYAPTVEHAMHAFHHTLYHACLAASTCLPTPATAVSTPAGLASVATSATPARAAP